MEINLGEIAKIEVYKMDCFSWDEIRMDVYLTDGTIHVKSEEDDDWIDFLAVVDDLPGFVTDWYDRVLLPAFKENRMIIYSGYSPEVSSDG